MLIWLNENVGFHPSFSRHGITQASSIMLIWLNENVLIFIDNLREMLKKRVCSISFYPKSAQVVL